MRNASPVCMRPLSCAFHSDASFRVQISQASFRLEVGMFLHRGLVFAFHDHIRVRKARFHIPLADAVMHADIVVAALRVQPQRIRLHGLDRIREYRQVLIFDLDEFRRVRSLRFGLCHHRGDLVTDEAHHIRGDSV